MTDTEMKRLKADASGNTGLSEALAQAVTAFSTGDDAVCFLVSRGFDVTTSDLARAAGEIEPGKPAGSRRKKDGYGALMRFMRRH